jgi:hypothetical protein
MVHLREPLLEIFAQGTVKVDFFLFIDGLDEHSGDHRELLRTTLEISKATAVLSFAW